MVCEVIKFDPFFHFLLELLSREGDMPSYRLNIEHCALLQGKQ